MDNGNLVFKKAMHEKTVISTIGLSRNNFFSLKSMFRIKKQLNEKYSLDEPENPQADIVFVDSQNSTALSTLKKFKHINSSITAIMIISKNQPSVEKINIERPFVIKRVIDALQQATQSTTQLSLIKKPQSNKAANRILVVDDSFPVRKYMEDKIPKLSPVPVNLSFAASGEQAMEQFKEYQPHLVFLDVMMPDVDGYKVCKWLKLAQPTVHITLLTGKKSPFDKVRGAMAGCNDYLVKPPQDNQLIRVLTSACDKQVYEDNIGLLMSQ